MTRHLVPRLALLLTCSLPACNGGDKADLVDDTGASEGTLPDLPTASCNGLDHDWVPLEQVGGLIDWEEAEEFSLDLDSVKSLMGLAGSDDPSVALYGVKVYRVRYLTQDKGETIEASGLLAFPDEPGLEAQTLLYLHPTTGLEDFCGPSGRDLIWAGVPIVLASAGYAVAAPDYLGQNGYGAEADFYHPWLVAEPTAVASLDSVRAMWAFAGGEGDPDLDISVKEEALLMGASQGGGAAFWVERYAPEYLPELDLIGSVAAVPVADLVTWADLAKEELTVASIAIPLALAAMKDWYGVDNSLDEIIPTDELDRFYETIDTECPESAVPEDVESLSDAYQQSWMDSVDPDDLDAWEPWSCLLAENSVGSSPVSQGTGVPTFVTIGSEDSVALTGAQYSAIDDLCASGHAIVAVECDGTEHTETVELTLDLQLAALNTLAAGGSLDGEVCGTIETISCRD